MRKTNQSMPGMKQPALQGSNACMFDYGCLLHAVPEVPIDLLTASPSSMKACKLVTLQKHHTKQGGASLQSNHMAHSVTWPMVGLVRQPTCPLPSQQGTCTQRVSQVWAG
jgi:hypothetical protein